ncbi:DUF4031 domain-containing protein [Kordiimonas aestuarii]|uniref:DUF4031 domain-containing protein n=1 Tax=Kordiimonas aestuarii TaxID=1005925 RepID=UPI0021D02ECC|nr:DUF4031 domain-containing protein [Kordiimonas aestuarii]
MAVFIDPPWDWGHRFGPSSHLLSDLAGVDGTCELTAFGYDIGLMPAWLQYAGSAKEHFDLFGPRIEWALDAGAVLVHRRELVKIIRLKRVFYLPGSPQ